MKLTKQDFLIICYVAVDEYIKRLEYYGINDIFDEYYLLREKLEKILTEVLCE
jgi:hypothetical protein